MTNIRADKSTEGKRKRLANTLIWYFVRTGFFIVGNIEIVKKKAHVDYRQYLGDHWVEDPNLKAPIIVSNQISFGDPALLVVEYFPRFVSNIGLRRIPFLGTLLDSLNCLYVQRCGGDEKETKKHTIAKVKEHIDEFDKGI